MPCAVPIDCNASDGEVLLKHRSIKVFAFSWVLKAWRTEGFEMVVCFVLGLFVVFFKWQTANANIL